MIFIPSKQRSERLRGTIHHAVQTGFPITVLVEPADYSTYRRMLRQEGLIGRVELHRLKKDDQGIARTRRAALRLADKRGLLCMMQCDDDVRIGPDTHLLFTYMEENRNVSGAGVWLSYYDFSLGIKKGTGPHPHKGGMGTRAWVVNVEACMGLGIFRVPIPTREDSDMQLRLTSEGFTPWVIHSDVPAVSVAKRHEPGGMSTIPGTHVEREQLAYDYFCDKYGEQYFRWTKRGMQVMWTKFLDHHQPGWRNG